MDVLSGGRTILGVGAGWHRPEFDAFSRWESDGVRVDQTTEGLDLILQLLGGDTVDFQGEHYSASGAQVAPRPVQRPHPPLWFGTSGERMMELTARHGNGWIPTLIGPNEYRRGMEKPPVTPRRDGCAGRYRGRSARLHGIHRRQSLPGHDQGVRGCWLRLLRSGVVVPTGRDGPANRLGSAAR